MTNLEKLRETFPKTIFIFRKNGNGETVAIMVSDEWLQGDYDQMYKDAEPCDAVSREAVLDAIDKWVKDKSTYIALAINEGRSLLERIKALPPVTPKQKTGHWVEIGDEPYDTWECDNCGFVIDGSGCFDPEEYRDIYKYCPNCGAKKDGRGEQMIIPKDIVEKMEQANALLSEIDAWLDENVDLYDAEYAPYDYYCFTDKPEGKPIRGGEYCDQHQIGEDSYAGYYFYPTEKGNYFCFKFWV